MVTLCPDSQIVRPQMPAIERVFTSYIYSRLYYSTFLWGEGARSRLKDHVTPADRS